MLPNFKKRLPTFNDLLPIRQWHFILTSLYKTIESYTLTTDQFTTLLLQGEACLNSRPLTANLSDPNELSALTLSYF